MNTDSVDFCLLISQAHASLNLKLDDELGTYHGLGLSDLMLLRTLSLAEGGRLPVADLMRPMGARRSAIMRQVMLLEKTGLVQREASARDGTREVVIRAAGVRVLNEALASAEQVCSSMMSTLSPALLPAARVTLSTVCTTDALAI